MKIRLGFYDLLIYFFSVLEVEWDIFHSMKLLEGVSILFGRNMIWAVELEECEEEIHLYAVYDFSSFYADNYWLYWPYLLSWTAGLLDTVNGFGSFLVHFLAKAGLFDPTHGILPSSLYT